MIKAESQLTCNASSLVLRAKKEIDLDYVTTLTTTVFKKELLQIDRDIWCRWGQSNQSDAPAIGKCVERHLPNLQHWLICFFIAPAFDPTQVRQYGKLEKTHTIEFVFLIDLFPTQMIPLYFSARDMLQKQPESIPSVGIYWLIFNKADRNTPINLRSMVSARTLSGNFEQTLCEFKQGFYSSVDRISHTDRLATGYGHHRRFTPWTLGCANFQAF